MAVPGVILAVSVPIGHGGVSLLCVFLCWLYFRVLSVASRVCIFSVRPSTYIPLPLSYFVFLHNLPISMVVFVAFVVSIPLWMLCLGYWVVGFGL